MKVIKRIRRESLEQKIHNFCLDTGIVSKVVVFLYVLISAIIALTSRDYLYSFLGLFSMRIT